MTAVTVLTGGSTPERDVALAGAAQVVGALRARGHRVTVVDTVQGALTPDAERATLVPVGAAPPTSEALARLAARERGTALLDLPAMRDAEATFLVLHGRQGEGGDLQTLLDAAGRLYTGSGPTGSMLAMDKDVAKRLFTVAGIPTARWAMWPAGEATIATLGVPLVVKPSKAGSTVGLSLVRRPNELQAAVARARAVDDEVMLEEFIPGRELTVGVLGDEALAVGEIVPSHEIFDYECKYTPGMSREIFPADLPAELAHRVRQLGRTAHRALKLRDFSRVDFRLAADGTPLCLEANTLPGLTTTSLLPQSAAAAGIPFEELCERMLRLALRRAGRRNKVETSGNVD